MEKRICVVTGSRAEYGLLRGLLRGIAAAPDLALQLVVTGSHLASDHGMTVTEIEADGLGIDRRVAVLGASDARPDIAQALGTAVSGLAQAIAELAPDAVLILGDRYEIFAAAQAAVILGVPLVHLYGGEVTEGAWDDRLRHAISKLADLHFVAAEPYRRRLAQLGEDPERVFTVGTLAVDTALAFEPMTHDTLACELGLPLWSPTFLVTYHPVTCRAGDDADAVGNLLAALDCQAGARIVITGTNADAGRERIAAMLRAYAAQRPDRVSLHASLGQRRYLSVMRHAQAVVGNSSSGLIEAPALGVPTVNIGDRQKGRLKAVSVIDCVEDQAAIAAALRRALDPAFRARLAGQALPYGGGRVAERIVALLRETDLGALKAKRFCDLPAPCAC